MIFNNLVKLEQVINYVSTTNAGYNVLSLQFKLRSLKDDYCSLLVPIPGVIIDIFKHENNENLLADAITQLTDYETTTHHSSNHIDCDMILINEVYDSVIEASQNEVSMSSANSDILAELYNGWDFLLVKFKNTGIVNYTVPLSIVYDSPIITSEMKPQHYIPALSNISNNKKGIYKNGPIITELSNQIINNRIILIGCSRNREDLLGKTIRFPITPHNEIINDHLHLINIEDELTANSDIFIDIDTLKYSYFRSHFNKQLEIDNIEL